MYIILAIYSGGEWGGGGGGGAVPALCFNCSINITSEYQNGLRNTLKRAVGSKNVVVKLIAYDVGECVRKQPPGGGYGRGVCPLTREVRKVEPLDT